MMRNVYFIAAILFCALSVGYLTVLFGADFSAKKNTSSLYSIEVAEYKYPVYTNYFENIDGVFELNSNNVYHYFVGLTKSYSEAKKIKAKVYVKGYKKAKIVDLKKEFSESQISRINNNPKFEKRKDKILVSKLENLDKQKFYSVCVRVDSALLAVDDFSNSNIKVYQQDGKYFYVQGRFAKIKTAKKNKITYSKEAKLVLFENGKMSFLSNPIKKKQNVVIDKQYRKKKDLNKIRKWKTPNIKRKEGVYIDYYYDFAGTLIENSKKRKIADDYQIQIMASKTEMDASCFHMKNVVICFDNEEKLYRYLYGSFDNYWVCRRKLREVRLKGYSDAFIVKL